MKRHIIFFIILISLQSFSQMKEMTYNTNTIDEKFVPNERINKIFDKNINDEISLYVEQTNDTTFSIYIFNNSNKELGVSRQDSRLYLIQEAKDQNGIWKPIEFWRYSTCGNSYLSESLNSKGVLKTDSKSYNGNFQTEIRFKFLNNEKNYYSNIVKGNIYTLKFDLPSILKNDLSFNDVQKVAGDKIAKELIFLYPKAIDEYSRKRKEYLKNLEEKRNNSKK